MNGMRSTWNAARRNRNVGTKAHGHGQDNRFSVPESWHVLKRFYEQLSSFVPVVREVCGHELVFLVEPTRPDWFHAASVEDICAVLSHLPDEDRLAFDLVVLRQPTRKQRILSPVWGRAVFVFDVPEYSGSAIILEAQTEQPFKWPGSLSPERLRELNRLAQDGHVIHKAKRGFDVRPTANSLRSTVLYRTLLHEVGHHVDFKRCSSEEWDSKTLSDKEDFAHRYAAEKFAYLRGMGVVPLLPILDEASLSESNLSLKWFQPS